MNSNAKLAIGRSFLGTAAIASGAIQLVTGDFVRLLAKWPDWMPGDAAWAYATGALLVVLGLAIVSGFRAGTAALALAALLVAVLLFWGLPHAVAVPGMEQPWRRGFVWTNPLKTLALAGGAALVAGRLTRAAPVLLAAFLLVCGIQHFVYSDFVLTLVPAWIPPGQRFWTYLTGFALIAGGVGLLVPRLSRLAASLSALMIFLWVLLLHIPRALTEAAHANEAAGACEALALSGVALMVAAAGDTAARVRR
jgi:uncharacterized membrane protein